MPHILVCKVFRRVPEMDVLLRKAVAKHRIGSKLAADGIWVQLVDFVTYSFAITDAVVSCVRTSPVMQVVDP